MRWRQNEMFPWFYGADLARRSLRPFYIYNYVRERSARRPEITVLHVLSSVIFFPDDTAAMSQS